MFILSYFTETMEWEHVVISKNIKQSCSKIGLGGFHLWRASDGAVRSDSGLAMAGGLIRDTHRTWLTGFHRYIRKVSPFAAEPCAMRDGLQLAGTRNQSGISNLVPDCRLLMTELLVATIDHVYREGNSCADALASNTCSTNGKAFPIFCFSFFWSNGMEFYYHYLL